MQNPEPKCKTCGKSLTAPGQMLAEQVDEESSSCARLREIAQQRQALTSRMQAGIVGVIGSDSVDTLDMVAHRKSLAQLDATLKAEAEGLAGGMRHTPGQP